jgi:hypothetical protein
MNNLDINIVSTKNIKKQSKILKRTVFHINRKNNTHINTGQLKDIYESFRDKYGNNNIMIRAVNSTGMFTFKGFDGIDLDVQDHDDYYENKVASTSQFEYFYSVEITVQK